MKDNLILIGFMGCGKSSVGIRLSYRLKRTVIDTDQWIEEREKKTISAIFAETGEESFRRMETECLENLLQSANRQIISVGGGLVMREENRRLLKQLGTVIYLRVTPEAVYERVKEDKSRPLLQVEDPLKEIRKLLAYRDPVYEACADLIIDVTDKSFEEILDRIEADAEKETQSKRLKEE